MRTVIDFYLPSPYRPKGVINSVEEWFENSLMPPQMEGSWIKEIFPEQILHLKKPNHISNYIHPSFNACNKSITCQKFHLSFFKNAKIVNEEGVIISSDNKVFADFTYELLGKPIEKHTVFNSRINKSQVKNGCVATINYPGNIGYHHWIFESLPRLKLLEDVIDKIDYLIVPSNLKKFHIESLNLLGIPEKKLLRIKNGDHLLCKNLFVPSILRRSIHSCNFLRESFIPKDVAKPYRLIYISRNDALYRKIINEKEIEEYLKEIGFEIIQMSKLSFLKQVKICAEARIIVGPHGAGLSNTVFCSNAKILEIYSQTYVHVGNWILANQLGNEYYYLLGEDEPGNSPPPWRNFKVDMKSFKQTIEWMMNDC